MTHFSASTKTAAIVAATAFLTATGSETTHANPADPDAPSTNVAAFATAAASPRSWTLVQIGYRVKLDRMPG